jgi:hypothetical protein
MSSSVICAAVEGTVDEAVVRKLIEHVGGVAGDVHGRKGKAHLRKRIRGYIQAAEHSPWLVLVDLDNDPACAPLLRSAWLQEPAPAHLCFRVAVRAVEAWFLADAERIATFLGVALSQIPMRPETLNDPKATLVSLARNSRRREIREDMVPRPESRTTVGPAYVSRMIEFAQQHWRPDVAAQRADSLRRALRCLRRLS